MKAYKTSEAQRARASAAYKRDPQAALERRMARYWADPEKERAYFRSDAARERKNAKRLAWSRANPERQRAINEAAHLKRYHGLTVEAHRAMVERQGGLCAICRQPPQGNRHCKKLHVDHDHASGVIRELLCADCNRGLGLFRDDPRVLAAAAWYLDRHRTKRQSA